jgi:hypothetical protein
LRRRMFSAICTGTDRPLRSLALLDDIPVGAE